MSRKTPFVPTALLHYCEWVSEQLGQHRPDEFITYGEEHIDPALAHLIQAGAIRLALLSGRRKLHSTHTNRRGEQMSFFGFVLPHTISYLAPDGQTYLECATVNSQLLQVGKNLHVKVKKHGEMGLVVSQMSGAYQQAVEAAKGDLTRSTADFVEVIKGKEDGEEDVGDEDEP